MRAGFFRSSVVQLVVRSGQPPESFPLDDVRSLSDWIDHSKRQQQRLVLLPEGTTSNNRALLKFPQLTAEGLGSYQGSLKVFCLVIKHEPPSVIRSSITSPVPSSPLNLPHILKSNQLPILLPGISPRTVTIKCPRTGPVLVKSIHQGLLEICAEVMTQAGKLKQTNQVGFQDKAGFLSYVSNRRM